MTPDSITSIEEYFMGYAFGRPVNEHGFRIILKTPIIARSKLPPVVSIDIAPRGSSEGFYKVAQALESCGFTITKNGPQ
jgi:hypothetical protein